MASWSQTWWLHIWKIDYLFEVNWQFCNV
jgi:hypothetical protein